MKCDIGGYILLLKVYVFIYFFIGIYYALFVIILISTGLPSKLPVAIFKAYDTVEMNCEYNQKQQWSKAWYKVMGPDKLQWVVHSDGNSNTDYSSRSTVFVNEQKRVLVMKMTNLELWDSGFYQCREAGGETILKEILLLVTLGRSKMFCGQLYQCQLLNLKIYLTCTYHLIFYQNSSKILF